MTEYDEQCAVFRWADRMEKQYPDLALLNSSQNGSRRSAHYGARLKAAGMKAGYPDIFLPVPRGDFHGLFIELKFGKGRLQETQKWWLESLVKRKYQCHVCWGADNAIKAIKDYLEGE